ncbi:MAG: DUF2461 domain-containing protein [Candidatus Heimdallarchaeota archaeon]|nr:DUF2461 domain-containing protein [Candidatus Heimdallarchaeota archaeon]
MAFFAQETLRFLIELKENNNREWFQENKKIYEKYVKKPFKKFIDELIFAIQEFDKELETDSKTAIFRINRDIRFSKDKTPYKPHISASIKSGKRTQANTPGYYIQISGETIALGGGAYFLDKFGLQAIREHILKNMEEFNQLLSKKDFKEKFGEVYGEKNKRLPTEFRDAAEMQPVLYNKQFYCHAEIPATMILDENILFLLSDFYQIVFRMNSFYNDALSKMNK